jgi:hypothetical protein
VIGFSISINKAYIFFNQINGVHIFGGFFCGTYVMSGDSFMGVKAGTSTSFDPCSLLFDLASTPFQHVFVDYLQHM